jgi:hypothetical protein
MAGFSIKKFLPGASRAKKVREEDSYSLLESQRNTQPAPPAYVAPYVSDEDDATLPKTQAIPIPPSPSHVRVGISSFPTIATPPSTEHVVQVTMAPTTTKEAGLELRQQMELKTKRDLFCMCLLTFLGGLMLGLILQEFAGPIWGYV